jgi:hypothetical protein
MIKYFIALMLTLTVLTGVVTPAWAEGGNQTVQEIEGTLNGINLDTRTITVNNQDYSLAAEVDVEINDQHILINQLANFVGKKVELKLNASNLVFKVEVKNTTNPLHGLVGTLNSFNFDTRKIIVNNQEYSLGDEVLIKNGDAPITSEQLGEYLNKTVEIILNASNVVVKVQVHVLNPGGGIDEVEGTLSAVNVNERTITVKEKIFSVSPEVVIEAQHQDGHLSFDQLGQYVGRRVEVKFKADKVVFKIEVKSETDDDDDDNESNEFKGELQAVDVTAKTIKVNGETYSVSPEVVIEVEHKDGHLPFNKLDQFIGRLVEARCKGDNVIYEMEIKDGTPDDDHIQGGKGNDDINGGVGNDEIHGGHGNDDLDGDEGDDKLDGNEGNDNLKGGPGDDDLNGDDDQPTVAAPAMASALTPMAAKKPNKKGNDVLDGGEGDDTINAGAGNDQIVGGLGKDTINAGEGNDQIWVSVGDVPAGQTESIDCGAGRDKINLVGFPKKIKPTNSQLTDTVTGGTYLFTGCEKFSQSRTLPSRTGPSSKVSVVASTAPITGMSIVVLTLQGTKIFETSQLTGSVLETLQEQAALPNGVYLYVFTQRNPDGTITDQQVRKLVTLR